MGIVSKIQHWFKAVTNVVTTKDLSQHRIHTCKYEDLCM